jgi:hypothetical protein
MSHGSGKAKYSCPDKGCRYSTSMAERMEEHKTKYGHGRVHKEWRGYKAVTKKKGA